MRYTRGSRGYHTDDVLHARVVDATQIDCARDPPDPGKQHNGKRSALESGASAAKRQRRNKAAASAKRPKPKLAERKADWHIP